jgi:hypothetical protein
MEPRTFEEFWPFYLSQHRQPVCRALHYVGTAAGVSVGVTALLTLNPLLVPVGLVCGYGPAWIGHFFIEKNRPATFKAPLWSFRGDFRMLARAVTGRLAEDLAKLDAAPDGDGAAAGVR